MVGSKRKGGKGSSRSGEFEVDADAEEITEDGSAKKQGTKSRRPRREMREKIEVRDEERLLTRELSDWDSYQDDFDSNSDSDSDRC
jgi:hypothetical protein